MSRPGEILYAELACPIRRPTDRFGEYVIHVPWGMGRLATCTSANGPWDHQGLDHFTYRGWVTLCPEYPVNENTALWLLYDPDGASAPLYDMHGVDIIRTITWIAEHGWPDSWRHCVRVR